MGLPERRRMLNIASTAGTNTEIWADLDRDRVMIVADHLYVFWRTAEEAEAMAQQLQEGARELKRRRAERK